MSRIYIFYSRQGLTLHRVASFESQSKAFPESFNQFHFETILNLKILVRGVVYKGRQLTHNFPGPIHSSKS